MYTKDNILGFSFKTKTGSGQIYKIEKFSKDLIVIVVTHFYKHEKKFKNRRLNYALNALNNGNWIVTSKPVETEPNYSIF